MKMANDSSIESFAIRFLTKQAEGEPDTPVEKYAVKTLKRWVFRGGG